MEINYEARAVLVNNFGIVHPSDQTIGVTAIAAELQITEPVIVITVMKAEIQWGN